MGRPEKIRLGDVLVGQKLVTAEQLATALDQQKKSGRRLGRVLIDLGFVGEEQIAQALSRQLNQPYINLKQFSASPAVARRLPEGIARRFRAIVLEDRGATYLVGMADPTDLFAYDEIARSLKRDLEVAVVSEGVLIQTIDRLYRRTEEITGLAKELERDLGEDYIDFGRLGADLGAEEAPVVKLLQSVFEDAAQVGASDIHIEPQENAAHIRFRIDGVLVLQTQADIRIAPALVLRLKLMASLDISEKRLPQDGRFAIIVRQAPIDVRMSTMPTQYGESVVMRLLNRRTGLIGLDQLGMPPDMLARYREIVSRESGMVLVTGPTGSGKTTTLYATLSELNSVEKKVITVEDPVEYRLPGINQVQVNEKIELTFSRVLRSALRQDPDIILVGEMRDEETVQIGMRAALTGHLVLSTLHTRDSISTPFRLLDMGAPHYMVATSVQAVLAQRLVRVNCDGCSQPLAPLPVEIAWLTEDDPLESWKDQRFMRGRGCARCNGTGYLGRVGVYELLEMSPELVRATHNQDATTFSERAKAQLAGKTLRDGALALVRAGRSSIAEAIRVSSHVED
jgi:MSHA biogenesis protein MshE